MSLINKNCRVFNLICVKQPDRRGFYMFRVRRTDNVRAIGFTLTEALEFSQTNELSKIRDSQLIGKHSVPANFCTYEQEYEKNAVSIQK